MLQSVSSREAVAIFHSVDRLEKEFPHFPSSRLIRTSWMSRDYQFYILKVLNETNPSTFHSPICQIWNILKNLAALISHPVLAVPGKKNYWSARKIGQMAWNMGSFPESLPWCCGLNAHQVLSMLQMIWQDTKPPPLRFRLVGVMPRKSEPSWLYFWLWLAILMCHGHRVLDLCWVSLIT